MMALHKAGKLNQFSMTRPQVEIGFNINKAVCEIRTIRKAQSYSM